MLAFKKLLKIKQHFCVSNKCQIVLKIVSVCMSVWFLCVCVYTTVILHFKKSENFVNKNVEFSYFTKFRGRGNV
jgi:hypothetical protein